MDPWTFWIGGGITLGSGLMMVTRRNPVASVMWLVAAFLGMALLFFGLDAPFIGVVQVLVYVGAIIVLFLFVIMLLNLSPSGLTRIDRPRLKFLGLASAFAFIGIISGVVTGETFLDDSGQATGPMLDPATGEPYTSSVLPLADQLFNHHLLPFELASVLLLIAIIGSVALSKRRL